MRDLDARLSRLERMTPPDAAPMLVTIRRPDRPEGGYAFEVPQGQDDPRAPALPPKDWSTA